MVSTNPAGSVTIPLFRWAVYLVIGFYFCHLIALPVFITFDGHQYLNLADVVGSHRFPKDWPFTRTPLFPLLFKVSFKLVGRHPRAAWGVTCPRALAGVGVGGVYIRRTLGDWPAALSMILVSLFPPLLVYQHTILTEVGVFCFLAMLVGLLVWYPQSPDRRWLQVGALLVTLCAGYFFRQTLLPLAPVAAVLFAFGAWPTLPRPAGTSWKPRAILLAQSFLIIGVPCLSAQAWQRFGNDKGFFNIVITQTMVQQALIPPDSPLLGTHAQEYQEAIAVSQSSRNLNSGLRWDLFFQIFPKLAPAINQDPLAVFLDCIRTHPGRYLAAAGRVALLFSGCQGLNSEVEYHQNMVLNPQNMGLKNHMEGGFPNNERDFTQVAKPSLVLRCLWHLKRPYKVLLILASAVSVLGLAIGLFWRAHTLFSLCAIPLAYLLPYILMLDSVDRYAVPAQAILVLNLVAVPMLGWRAIRSKIAQAPVLTTHLPAEPNFVSLG